MAAKNNNDSGSYFQVASTPALNGPLFTVGAWVFHPTSPPTGAHTTVMARGTLDAGDLNSWALGPSSGSAAVRFAVRAPSDTQFNAVGPTPAGGTWYHVMGRVNGRTVDLFYDGRLVASTAMTQHMTAATTNLRFFQRATGNHVGDSVISHAFFLNCAPSNGECTRIMREGPRDVRPSNIVFYHSFDSLTTMPEVGAPFTIAGTGLMTRVPGYPLRPAGNNRLVTLYGGLAAPADPSVNSDFFFAAA